MMLQTAKQSHVRKTSTHVMIQMLLRLMAASYNLRGSLNAYLRCDTGWINFSVGIRTDSGSVVAGIIFRDGNVTVSDKIPTNADIVLHFNSDKSVKKLLSSIPTEQIFLIMKNQLKFDGNVAYLNLFFFLLSLLINKKQKKLMENERKTNQKNLLKGSPKARTDLSGELQARRAYRMKAESLDPASNI